ncbi:hypothetical protein B0T16DRAFT_414667 [Cercophora newfieldiana]|uniref:Glyoxalase-like domain-containing protein n=1 Tax=Cercophora newfieldiana TaxID=92897 RepID=A0AA39Y6R8_9PEZI|nr:hypothetical protein B0T16DRAFT_414667 [Cercophora newfieldiana]
MVEASRNQADGAEIKCLVTRPECSRHPNTPAPELFPNGRMDVPFFCHDSTPRADRVPNRDKEKTTHPCGAIGIASCLILVPKPQLVDYAYAYSLITGARSVPVVREGSPNEPSAYTLVIGAPERRRYSTIVVHAAETDEDLRRMQERGVGLSELAIGIKAHGPGGKKAWQLGPTGIESTIWLQSV